MVRPDVTDTADWFGLVKNASTRVVPEEVLAGTEIPGGGGRERLYLTLQCHHHNDSCTEMGSDESHLNVSLTVRDQVTRQCPQTTTFEEKGEPKQNRTEVLLLSSLTPSRQVKPAHIII